MRNKINNSQIPIVILGCVTILATTLVIATSEKDKDLTPFMLIMSSTLGGCLGILRGDKDQPPTPPTTEKPVKYDFFDQ